LTDQELIQFLHDFAGTYTIERLTVATGLSKYEINRVIREHKLKHLLYDPIPDIVEFVGEAPVDTLTINDVAEKFNLSYDLASRLLRKTGMIEKIHKTWGYKKLNRLNDSKLAEMLSRMAVSEVAEVNRDNNVRPCSRQGLYQFCRDNCITPLKLSEAKAIRKLEKEQG
jgi:hypothetical protein